MIGLIRVFSPIFLGCCLALPALAQQVGVTSVAAGEPRGTPPSQSERILRVGIDVSANERIVTRTNDRAHLVFLDGSALTIGPDSEIMIDRFVYDPGRETGELAMSTTRGVFRYVGGAISKKSAVVVKTPSASIGIRGGIMTVAIARDGSAIVTFLYGQSLTVTGFGGTSVATRAGSQIFVPYNGPPQPPIVLPPGALQSFLSVFEQLIGNGGAAPGDNALVNALLTALNSSLGPQGPGVNAWYNYLRNVGNQTLTTTNATQRLLSSPPVTGVAAPPPPPPDYCPPGNEGGYRGGRGNRGRGP
jgi:hypothetical protein